MKTFDEWWHAQELPKTVKPGILGRAFRELMEKGWDAALETCPGNFRWTTEPPTEEGYYWLEWDSVKKVQTIGWISEWYFSRMVRFYTRWAGPIRPPGE